jgi:hypothetical protein
MCFVFVSCLSKYLFIPLPTLDSNDSGYSKEGKIGIYQEDDQGHCADQGKPSKLVSYLIPILLIA